MAWPQGCCLIAQSSWIKINGVDLLGFRLNSLKQQSGNLVANKSHYHLVMIVIRIYSSSHVIAGCARMKSFLQKVARFYLQFADDGLAVRVEIGR